MDDRAGFKSNTVVTATSSGGTLLLCFCSGQARQCSEAGNDKLSLSTGGATHASEETVTSEAYKRGRASAVDPHTTLSLAMRDVKCGNLQSYPRQFHGPQQSPQFSENSAQWGENEGCARACAGTWGSLSGEIWRGDCLRSTMEMGSLA